MAKSDDTSFISKDDVLKHIDSGALNNMLRLSKGENEQVFTEDDLRNCQQYLTALFRLLLIEKHMSMPEFDERWVSVSKRSNIAKSKWQSDRANMKNTMRGKSLTCYVFSNLLFYLDFAVIDMSLTVVDQKTNEVSTVKLSDIKKILTQADNLEGDDEE